MITYDIIKTSTPQQRRAKRTITHDDPDWKQQTLKRAYDACKFHEGDYVKIRKTPDRGQIFAVYDDIQHVNWVGMRPFFVAVNMKDGRMVMAHPAQLKRTNSL